MGLLYNNMKLYIHFVYFGWLLKRLMSPIIMGGFSLSDSDSHSELTGVKP